MSALTNCLLIEAKAIASTAEKLDSNQVEKSFKLLKKCFTNRGKLITSGVGKSGIVARKIAATFSSLGLTSLYLNPLDALHGRMVPFIVDCLKNGDLKSLLAKPSELVYGMLDRAIDANYAIKDFRELFPKSKITKLPNAGHFSQEDEPQVIIDLIRNFVQIN